MQIKLIFKQIIDHQASTIMGGGVWKILGITWF